jgi:hypothetical protein
MRNPKLPPPAFSRVGTDWRCNTEGCEKVMKESERGDHRRAHNRDLVKRDRKVLKAKKN